MSIGDFDPTHLTSAYLTTPVSAPARRPNQVFFKTRKEERGRWDDEWELLE